MAGDACRTGTGGPRDLENHRSTEPELRFPGRRGRWIMIPGAVSCCPATQLGKLWGIGDDRIESQFHVTAGGESPAFESGHRIFAVHEEHGVLVAIAEGSCAEGSFKVAKSTVSRAAWKYPGQAARRSRIRETRCQYGSMIVACMVYPASPTSFRCTCVLITPVTHTGSNSSLIG